MSVSPLTTFQTWKHFRQRLKRRYIPNISSNFFYERGKTLDYQFTTEDLDKIDAGIREKYLKAAKSPEGLFKYPTGKKGLKALHYDKSLIDKLPN